jgi:hypothetical protein
MRRRHAAAGFAALLVALLGGTNVLALAPTGSASRPDWVEEGQSHTFDLADGARVHALRIKTEQSPASAQAAGTGAVVTGNGINYHLGPIVAAEKVAAIYWSSSTIYSGGPTPGTFGTTGDNSLVGYFVGNLHGSPYYNINTTYGDIGGNTVGNTLAYSGYWADNAAPPSGTQNVADSSIQSEILSAFSLNKLAYDASTVYAVFSSGAVNLGGGFGGQNGTSFQYCAYHGWFNSTYGRVLYAVMPYDAAYPSSCSMPLGPNGDAGADAEVNTLAHELEEANTDPQLNAWYDSAGNENADKCAWNFGTTFSSGTGVASIAVGTKNFLVQQNWLNANGGSCAQGYSPVVATVPGAPTLNSATPGAGSVALSWTAPASNGGASITGYKVYRATTSGGEGATPVATVGNVTSYTDSGLTGGTPYYYEVAAVNSAGTGSVSGERSATPTIATVPGAPSLTAAPSSRRGVQLNWTPAAPNGNTLTGYVIYRSSGGGGWAQLTTRSATSTSYRDSNTSSGTLYSYEVRAVAGSIQGTLSNIASATAR